MVCGVGEHLGGDVVQERLDRIEVLADLDRVPGRRPPVPLARSWDHPVDEHDQGDLSPGCHQRRHEPAERLTDDHDVFAVGDRLDHDIGVLGQAGRLVRDRQVHRHDVVPEQREQRCDPVPIPAVAAGTVNERVSGSHAV